MLPWAHPNPQPKRHLDRFSHYCTAHGRVSSGIHGYVLPLKIAPSHRGSGPHLTHGFFSQPAPKTQTVSRSVQPFLHRLLQSLPMLYNGPHIPFKITHFSGRSGPSHGSLGPPESTTKTASPSVQPFFYGSRLSQTNRPRYSVCNNKPPLYVRSSAMLP